MFQVLTTIKDHFDQVFFGLFKGTLDRLSKLKITCSNKSLLTKLDALGETFDSPLQAAKERISNEISKTKELQEKASAASHACSADTCAEQYLSRDLAMKANEVLKVPPWIYHCI